MVMIIVSQLIKFSTLSLQEIGLGSVERCKGFTAHLTKLLIKQRSSLTALTEQWIILRLLVFLHSGHASNSFHKKSIPNPNEKGSL